MSRLARWAVLGVVVTGGLACAAVWSRGRSHPVAVESRPAPAPASLPASESSGTALTVTVKDLRNRKGNLIFGVFKSAGGFPNVEKKAVYWEVKKVDAAGVTFTAHLPPGRYAASVLHDENRSGDMDRNLVGVPTEGYGVTNNPKPPLRAATFEEAAFDLPPEGAEMTISVQYF